MALPTSHLSEVQRFILESLPKHADDIAKVTSQRFQISRQAANKQLRRLVTLGLLTAEGETKSRRYRPEILGKVRETFQTAGLQEDVVWRESIAPALEGVGKNVLDICHYGFTEIVNNAIDHSSSPRVFVGADVSTSEISLLVVDEGIGIFRKIKDALNLEDERHAILELVKGKLTTDPAHHTGEGIFFTSRMFDRFGVLSGKLYLGHHREGRDWLIEDRVVSTTGTSVAMAISPWSSHTSKEVFERYSTDQEDYAFSRTHVVVALAQTETEPLVSRSQAKRVLMRLDRFREIVLDFKGVESIGPAFADEIFRVFHTEHPEINVTVFNATPDVDRMIRRAQAVRVDAGDRIARTLAGKAKAEPTSSI